MNRLKDKVALVAGAGSIAPRWSNGKATAVLSDVFTAAKPYPMMSRS
jgi:hypothetical protein